jgi:hypothetical protein
VHDELLASAKAHGTGRRLGKAAKTLRGTESTFHRLRVGDVRVMYDVIAEEGVPAGPRNHGSQGARPVAQESMTRRVALADGRDVLAAPSCAMPTPR